MRGGGRTGRGVRGGGHTGRGARSGRRGHGNDDKWIWNSTKKSKNTLHKLSFSGAAAGPIGAAVGIRNPLDCFHLFLPTAFFDDLLFQTNLYADQQRAAKQDHSLWDPIRMEELLAFIGINIAMDIVSLPSLEDYWSTDPILSHAWFRTIMSRNCFRQILRYVHVADNSTAPTRTDPS